MPMGGSGGGSGGSRRMGGMGESKKKKLRPHLGWLEDGGEALSLLFYFSLKIHQ